MERTKEIIELFNIEIRKAEKKKENQGKISKKFERKFGISINRGAYLFYRAYEIQRAKDGDRKAIIKLLDRFVLGGTIGKASTDINKDDEKPFEIKYHEPMKESEYKDMNDIIDKDDSNKSEVERNNNSGIIKKLISKITGSIIIKRQKLFWESLRLIDNIDEDEIIKYSSYLFDRISSFASEEDRIAYCKMISKEIDSGIYVAIDSALCLEKEYFVLFFFNNSIEYFLDEIIETISKLGIPTNTLFDNDSEIIRNGVYKIEQKETISNNMAQASLIPKYIKEGQEDSISCLFKNGCTKNKIKINTTSTEFIVEFHKLIPMINNVTLASDNTLIKENFVQKNGNPISDATISEALKKAKQCKIS